VTNNIYQRVLQHKKGQLDGFTKRYNIDRLAYYEVFEHIGNAIAREKQIKAWTRAKRIALIKGLNPAWQDLAEGWGENIEMRVPPLAG
jgi:putative endonuclease